jgi:assimilatory nitrate reductase catalytic subunit
MSRSFVAAALTGTASEAEGIRVLAGRSGASRPDCGETICACFQIGLNQIRAAIAEGLCVTLADVGTALKAGTNCGSCRPEIERIIQAAA